MKLRLWFKFLLVWLGFGDLLIEFCEQCGVAQPIDWIAPNHLWLEVHGDENGVLCPACFDTTALRKGINLRWYPSAN